MFYLKTLITLVTLCSFGSIFIYPCYSVRCRYVANSDGMTNNTPLEIIYGENYADGNYHQVNVEIGEYTKMYTYTFPYKASNVSVVRSKAKDLRYDLDEISYFVGMPLAERSIAKDILLSTYNFEGCLDIISFNGNLELSETSFMRNPGLSFHGKYAKGCTLCVPTFLKSFSRKDETLLVESNVNVHTFIVNFFYKTYLQNGVIFSLISSHVRSSVVLLLRQNQLELRITTNEYNSSILLTHHGISLDDGVWRKIKIEILPDSVSFVIDKSRIVNEFKKSFSFRFPQLVTFGGFYHSSPGFIGCIKDVFFGKNLVPINKLLNLDINANFEERMCRMRDFCFPSRPCKNHGVCQQNAIRSQCYCDQTGFSGPTCEALGNPNIRKTCGEYYKAGYRYDGIYVVRPGTSPPFKVKCKMDNFGGPITIIDTNQNNETFVLTGKDFDDNFYYHQISYQVSKRQINDLISVSKSCQQYVRYNCYQSTLLNSKDRQKQSSSIGLRWYTRFGSLRNYWGGNVNNSNSCKCSFKKECSERNLSCNCDIMDAKMRYDDGYITEIGDLPISKVRVSRKGTTHRSSFQIGPLECNGNLSEIYFLYQKKRSSPSSIVQKPSKTTTPIVSKPASVFIPNEIIVGTSFDERNRNKTLNKSGEGVRNFIVLDSKLLYVVIAIMIALVIMCMFLLVFRRHVCCCYHENRAKPQIIELYKEEVNRNNNANILQVSNDVTVCVDDLVLPFARIQPYTQSSSESSASTTDLERCYYSPEKDFDSEAKKYHKSDDSPVPRRSILKTKRDNPQRYKSRGSDESSNTITRLNNPPHGYHKNLDSYREKDFNYDIDIREKFHSISPLKQKVLELSTKSKHTVSRNSLYYNRDSLSSIRTSSCSSANDSDTPGEGEDRGECNFNMELASVSKFDRGKIVRFNDEGCGNDQRHYKSKKNLLTVDLSETESFLFYKEQNKTLV